MIPVSDAETLAKKHGLQQVIIFAWDGKQTHVVTYGESIEDCAQAAVGANKIKKGWGWPEDTLVEPPRVQALLDKIADLEDRLDLAYLEMAGEDS